MKSLIQSFQIYRQAPNTFKPLLHYTRNKYNFTQHSLTTNDEINSQPHAKHSPTRNLQGVS